MIFKRDTQSSRAKNSREREREREREFFHGGAFWSYTNSAPKSTENLKFYLQTEKFPSFSEYSLEQR